MEDILVKDDIKVENMIYEVRGKYVMLDSDLALLYECKNGTKSINLAVKRHINRFPERFMFQLTEEECKSISRFQIETLNGRGHNIKYFPYAFTEQGIAMLATVLRTSVAEEMSIKIMDAFVKMRHYLLNTIGDNKYINEMLLKHDNEITEHGNSIKLLQESLDKLEKDKEINEVYFNGKIYDAYSKVLDIFSEAKKELIIVDRYTDKTILDMIKNLECNVILITSKRGKLTELDIDKYNSDYNNLSVYYDDTFHDRYFIIDRDCLYHSGNSINHIGFRKSSIDIIHDENVKELIISDINIIIGGICSE